MVQEPLRRYPEGTRPPPRKAWGRRGRGSSSVRKKKQTSIGSLLFRSCRDGPCDLPSAEGRVTLSETLRFPDAKGWGIPQVLGALFFAPQYSFLAKSCDLEISEGDFSQQ